MNKIKSILLFKFLYNIIYCSKFILNEVHFSSCKFILTGSSQTKIFFFFLTCYKNKNEGNYDACRQTLFVPLISRLESLDEERKTSGHMLENELVYDYICKKFSISALLHNHIR
jgi:hypothetical protein